MNSSEALMAFRRSAASVLPRAFRAWLDAYRGRLAHRRYRSLGLQRTFDAIYASGVWGKGSGWGSHNVHQDRYCEMLFPLMAQLGTSSVADLGCGDFAVGSRVARNVDRYIGIDVSTKVVAQNTADHSSPGRVEFMNADITRDPLPRTDMALLRQVLQHLNNEEIVGVLRNIARTYPMTVVTEHLYTGEGAIPNLDITHGPGTRVLVKSGVFLDQPPFNSEIKAAQLFDIPVQPGETLRTWLVTPASIPASLSHNGPPA